jgi:Uma2 family endonuclease
MTVHIAPSSKETCVLLENIRWATYEALLEDLGPHPGKRITYDSGQLEIMTTSPRHERIKSVIGLLLQAIAFEMGIPIVGVGSATWKREDLRRGFEPDACYYVTNVEAVRGKEDIDLKSDPPPDLLIEVDIARSWAGGEEIHAAFGIPEVWRFAGDRLRFYALEEVGGRRRYRETERSVAFPFLAAADLNRLLALRAHLDDTGLMHAVQEWLRQNRPAE